MPRIRVNEIELYYEVRGQGPPLLFLHGLGSSTRDWEEQLAFFSEHYQTLAFDLRGHGRSDKPPGPYSLPLLAADTAALIRTLGLAPAHLVGISMGGMIAFQLAVDAPELIRSLVLVNTGPELVLRTFKERLHFYSRLLIVRGLGMRKMGEVLSRKLFPRPEQEELRRKMTERWAQNDKRAYLDALKALIGWSVADRLETITHPTLVLAADQDYTPPSAKEAYAARMLQAEVLIIPDSRHATPVERPEEFNRAVAAFLARQA